LASVSVVYYAASTLDGYIAEADDTIDWLTGYQGRYEGEDAAPARGYEEFYAGVGALVSGSVTYEWVLDHIGPGGEWPYAGKPWWVLSSREPAIPDGEGVDVRVVRGSVPELFEEMVASAGERRLWIVGGGSVASQFADAGLLDEVEVTVVPVVLGGGKPLFGRRLEGDPMKLERAIPRASGMVELRFSIQR
jgi:dihydrofolate reductase